MEINYVCSLGSLCHSAEIIKQNGLKVCSYPFDWIFSDYNIVMHSIRNDFKIFLDKSFYMSISDKKCGHSYYIHHMFNHRNPLKDENDYNYYIRCVNRFKYLLQCKESKLFIMMFVNDEHDCHSDNFKKNIIHFNEKFSSYTSNYTLLVISHNPNKNNQYHNFIYNNDIHFLELHTLSRSNGGVFTNNADNDYLNNIIKSSYNFNIVPLNI